MATADVHPPFLLSEIRYQHGLIALKNSTEVSPESPEICKYESTFVHAPNGASSNPQNLNSESSIIASVGNISDWIKTSLSTDLGTEIEGENEDKKYIAHDLMGYLHDGLNGKERTCLQTLKAETENERNIDRSCWIDRIENLFERIPLFFSLDDVSDDQKTVKKLRGESEMESKIIHDSRSVKLVNISVILYDLFSANDRKRGVAHSNDGSCSCIYCRGEYRFRYGQNLVERKKKHMSHRLIICNFCSAPFTEKSSLKKHVELAHSSERPFSCKLCSSSFKQKVHLQRHEAIHRDERPYACKLCHLSFKLKTYLQRHELTHHDEKSPCEPRRFGCSLCLATFASKGGLKKHYQVHTMEKTFQCKYCSAMFSDKDSLLSHVKLHSVESPFVCDASAAEFKTGQNLNPPKDRHKPERLFECELCSEKFEEKRVLRQHLSVHSDVRPFRCDVCLVSFKKKGNLTRHAQTHRNVKLFE